MVKNIQLTVSEKNVTSEDCPLRWSSNTVDYITATFALDDEWKSCDLARAVWVAPQAQIVTVLDANDTCVVPHEVLSKIGKVYVNLYGIEYTDGEEFTRITTYPYNAIRIDGDAKIEGSETAPITPSQFEQFVETVLSETQKVTGMTATAETLPAGEDATASYSDGVLSFGIPQGEQGIQGVQGVQGERGETGAAGNGIESVTKTGSSGLVDTYTIRFTDGSSSTFTVTNGKDGSADIHWGDVQGSIANQTDLQNALNAKQNKLTAGTNITIDANNVISAAGGSGGGAVDSVNGKTGVVVLDADDVGALPDTTTASDLGAYVKPSSGIPKTDLASAVQSSLNKADTALQTAPVTSVNTKTGAVSLTASDLGAYTKPSTGIPKSDLASSVQASLEKADTALQSAPVTSVNSKTGAVSLSASDVGALPDSTTIPTKTSDLTNDSGFLTSAGAVTSFNGQHGAVTYTAPVQSVNGQTGAVTVSVPTKTSDLQNDSGYITSAPVSSVDGKTGTVTVIPTGGTTGQVLAKASDTDRDVEWVNQSGGGGGESIGSSIVQLAKGTKDAGITTASIGDGLIDTGLVLDDLRAYKYICVKIRLDDAKPYLGFRFGNTTFQVGSSNAIGLQFTWLDSAKTVLLPVSGGLGNAGIGGVPHNIPNNGNNVFTKLGDQIIHVGAIPFEDLPNSVVYVGITHMNGLAETTKSLIWAVYGVGDYQ